jgi:hypothetical protein
LIGASVARAAPQKDGAVDSLESAVESLSSAVGGSIAALPEVLGALGVGAARQLESLDPTLTRAAARSLSSWIVSSRDEALREGVERIPPAIRSALAGYVPEATLDRVRWREGGGGALSLQENLIRLGYTPAVTLDHVIVFQHRADALQDPKLWVHELMHVMQFERWGVDGFATRYLADHAGVEKEAAEYRWQWMKLAGLVPAPTRPDPQQ